MNSPKNWDLRIDSEVWKACKKFPRKDVEAIRAAIYEMSNNPFAGDTEKMKGKEYTWRRRVGSYRIFYELYMSRRQVEVYKVKRRSSNTY